NNFNFIEYSILHITMQIPVKGALFQPAVIIVTLYLTCHYESLDVKFAHGCGRYFNFNCRSVFKRLKYIDEIEVDFRVGSIYMCSFREIIVDYCTGNVTRGCSERGQCAGKLHRLI